MIERLTVIRKTAGAVRHHAFALGFADGNTEVGFTGGTEITLAALGGVQRDHMVARFHTGHALTDLNHHPGTFMAEHHREQTFRIITGKRVGIGMAYPGVTDFHQHFTFLRRCHINFNNFKG